MKVKCWLLTQQYRMDPKICSLISDIGYAGRLKTAKDVN